MTNLLLRHPGFMPQRRPSWRRVAVAAALACLPLAAIASAQTPPPASPPRPTDGDVQRSTPTFRATTSAVLLDVVVRDKKGRPLTDLRQDEFEILEDGAPVEVKAFGVVRGASPNLSAHEAATGQPDPMRRVTLVTLVFENLTQNGRDLSRRAAMEFLGKELPPDQWVSIYRLDERLWRTQAFTRSPAEIRAGIMAATRIGAREDGDALTGVGSFDFQRNEQAAEAAARQIGGGGATVDQNNVGAPPADPSGVAMAAVLQRMSAMIDRAQTEQRGQSTLYPLMSLIKSHGTLEGRKAMLLFSEGFVIPPNLEEAFRGIVSEANRSNVSVYAVDARGLDPSRSLDGARIALDRSARNSQRQMMTRGNEPVTIEDVMNSEYAEGALRQDTQGTLQMLAEETGGFLVANSNNLAERLARVAGDLDAYYEIAYVPRSTTYDGRFRKVEVKVKRRGAEVQSRSGYFALPPTEGAPLLPYEMPMLAAASASPLPTPFPFKATVFRFGETPRGMQHTVHVEVPLDQLTFEENRSTRTYALRFTVMAMVRAANGEVVERLSDAFPLEGPLDRLPALKRGRLVFKRQLWLAPGHYTVMAVARDQATERSSVRAMDLDVAATDPPLLSSLAVIRRIEPASPQPDVVEDPFRTDTMRIVPSLEVPISRAANPQVSAYVVVYPQQGRVPSMTFEFMRGDAVLGRSVAELPAPDPDGRIKYVASFPTTIFEPGAYRLRAVATLDGRTSTSDVSFSIVP